MKAKDLKSSILQMAVEGKLVPQDPNDEPASVLLERIREEKQRLIAEGKAKFPKGGESIIYTGSDGSPYEKRVDAKGRVLSEKCIEGEVPFGELPEGWVWARLENLCSVITDGDHQAPPQQADGVPFLVISDVSSGELDFSNTRHVSIDYFNSLEDSRRPCRGDLLLTVTGSFGIPVPVDTEENFCFQRHIALLRPLSCRPFMTNILLAPSTYKYFKAKATGTAQKTVSLSCLRSTLLALPPESEQQRIVGKLAQLMPLVEEYGKLEDACEALDAALPDRLRKSVLQMAVQGKLVPQDPSDKPAGVLLEHIREQRRKLIAEKKIKAPKGGESVIFRGSDGRRYEKRIDAKGRESEPVCIEDEIPFEMPESWEWVRLSTVLQLSSGLGYKKDNLSVKGEHMVRVLRGGNIGEDDEPLIKDNDVLISAEFVDDSLLLRDGQIITPAVTSLENVGKAAIVRNADGETVCGGFVFYLTPYLKSICHSEYLHRYLASPGHIAFCKSVVKKSGQAFYNLSKASLNSALIAIPPLAEQHRIVERVNELMPLITNQ